MHPWLRIQPTLSRLSSGYRGLTWKEWCGCAFDTHPTHSFASCDREIRVLSRDRRKRVFASGEHTLEPKWS